MLIEKEQSRFSIIFVLTSQYRSHSLLLNSVVHCPRWFLSMRSRRLIFQTEGENSKVVTFLYSYNCCGQLTCRLFNIALSTG